MNGIKIKIIIICYILFVFSSYVFGINKEAQYIPYDSNNVISINLKNINNKINLNKKDFFADFYDLLQYYKYGNEFNNLPDLFNPELYDTEIEGGILHIFTKTDHDLKNMENIIGLISTLNNKKLFEKILVEFNLIQNKNQIGKIDDFNYIHLYHLLFAWDDYVLILLYNKSFINNKQQALNSFHNIFNGKQNNKKLLDKKTFKELQSKEWDIASWSDYGLAVNLLLKKFLIIHLWQKKILNMQKNV